MRSWNRTSRSISGVLLTFALVVGVVALVTEQPAEAASTKGVAWPSGFKSPLGTATVQLSTKYGAYDLGCPNADRSAPWRYYLDKGRTEHLGVDLAKPAGSKVYAIGEPSALSPVFVTTNFSLTYFIVSGEIENSGKSAWLVVPECEGMSVLTAWAAAGLPVTEGAREQQTAGA